MLARARALGAGRPAARPDALVRRRAGDGRRSAGPRRAPPTASRPRTWPSSRACAPATWHACAQRAGALRAHRRSASEGDRSRPDRRRAGRALEARTMSARGRADGRGERRRLARCLGSPQPLRRALCDPARPRAADARARRRRPVRARAALGRGWLCESARPCRSSTGRAGAAPSCQLVAARSHPDLLVLVPEALRESLGWDAGAANGEEGGTATAGKRKPSKEIRIEAVRAAIGVRDDDLGARPRQGRRRASGRADEPGRGERVPEDARGAGRRARFLLCSAAPDQLLPTIRSRCQEIVLPRAGARRRRSPGSRPRASAQPEVLLAASGGRPQEALRAGRARRRRRGLAALCPAASRAGDASARCTAGRCRAAVEALQKLCHDALSVACGGRAALFPGAAAARRTAGSSRSCALVARAGARRQPRSSTRGASIWPSRAWSSRAAKR